MGSLSGELEFQPLAKLGLVLGGGYHWQDGDRSISQSEHSFLAAANYTLTDAIATSFSWSRKVRPPSIRQLYDETRGNLALDYEKVETYEGRIDYQPETNWTLGLAVFNMNVDGFIERDDVTNLFQNVEKTRFNGAELSGSAVLFDRLRLRGSYSYLDSQDQTNSGRDELQNRPKNIFVADADIDLSHDFNFHLKTRRVWDQVFYSRRTPLVKARGDDFTVVDTSLRWSPRESLTLRIGADNLLDENYAEEYGLPSPGRFVYGGMEWTL